MALGRGLGNGVWLIFFWTVMESWLTILARKEQQTHGRAVYA